MPSHPSAKPRRAANGRVGVPTHHHRNARPWRRVDARLLQGEEPPSVVHRLAGRQQGEHLEALVQPSAPGGGIDTAIAHLTAVLSPGADTEHDAPRPHLGQRRQLTGDDQRMPEGQLIHRDPNVELVVTSQRRRRRDHAVESGAVVKAHVVADAHMIQAAVGRSGQKGSPPRRRRLENRVVDVDA